MRIPTASCTPGWSGSGRATALVGPRTTRGPVLRGTPSGYCHRGAAEREAGRPTSAPCAVTMPLLDHGPVPLTCPARCAGHTEHPVEMPGRARPPPRRRRGRGRPSARRRSPAGYPAGHRGAAGCEGVRRPGRAPSYCGSPPSCTWSNEAVTTRVARMCEGLHRVPCTSSVGHGPRSEARRRRRLLLRRRRNGSVPRRPACALRHVPRTSDPGPAPPVTGTECALSPRCRECR